HYVEILDLVSSADVVSLSNTATCQNRADRFTVVGHKQPVAHILPVTIHRNGFPTRRVQNDERDQLLRKLKWPVIVGTVRCQDRQSISVEVSPHEMIRSGF